MYYATAELSESEHEYLEQDYKWLLAYFNEVSVKEASTRGFARIFFSRQLLLAIKTAIFIK